MTKIETEFGKNKRKAFTSEMKNYGVFKVTNLKLNIYYVNIVWQIMKINPSRSERNI